MTALLSRVPDGGSEHRFDDVQRDRGDDFAANVDFAIRDLDKLLAEVERQRVKYAAHEAEAQWLAGLYDDLNVFRADRRASLEAKAEDLAGGLE